MRIFATALMMIAGPLRADEVGPDFLAGLEGLDPATVLVLGEVHDNPVHHVNQAIAVFAVRPTAVVFEMLDAAEAEIANGSFNSLEELQAALAWDQSGWPDFAIYTPVFQALVSTGWVLYPPATEDYDMRAIFSQPVVDARIYGAEVPRAEARRVFEVGAAEVFGPDAGLFGLGYDLPLEEQQLREEGQQEAHCGMLPPEMLPLFVEAQRLRDARLAQVALQALEETGGPVVVITGNGHARVDWGMPAVLAGRVDVLSIGQLEVRAEYAPYDHWLITEAVERADPCAAMSE